MAYSDPSIGTKRANYLLITDFERLEDWCQMVRVMYGSTPYLVGSALERPDFRDVDLRIILPDDEFDAHFAGARVRVANRAISTWGQRETGLPIDFQVQRQTEANAEFDGRRNPMGIRDMATVPTSGVPEPPR